MFAFLRHLFTPRVSNNYRPKILHPQILLLLTLFFFSAGILSSLVRHNYPQVLGISANVSVDQLLILTNQKRQQANLPPLTLNDQLDQAALNKGNNMFAQNYWAHIAPDGTTPWYFIKGAGYNYIFAGENLARGYNSATDVISAWMASTSHRENMLSQNYKDVGFAVLTGSLTGEDTVLVVEEFGSKDLAFENNLVQNQAQPTAQSQASSPTVQTEASSPTPTASQPNNSISASEPQTRNLAIASNSSSQIKPLINGQTFSSNIAAITVTIFMFVLILDMFIIERKKISRFVGHNLDHVLFFALIGALVLVILKGYII